MTIGIPTRNRVGLLERSLKSALDQDYPNLDVFVSDNASTDSTGELLSSFGTAIRYVSSSETLTIAENWNRTLDNAQGEYFLLLSDDDFLVPSAVSRLMETFLRDPGSVALVYGKSELLRETEGAAVSAMWTIPPESEPVSEFILQSYKSRRYYPTGATMCRTSEMRAKGGYSWGGFGLVLDMAMVVKICSMDTLRRVVFVPHVVFTSVVHKGNLSGSAGILEWSDEIYRLSRMAAGILNLPPRSAKEMLDCAEAYLIRFVFYLAMSRRRTLGDSVSLLTYVLRISVRHLNAASLPVFVRMLLKYLIPNKIIGRLRIIKSGQ
ncbi:MAG: glycosyltransferase family A protein [Elusimicrobiales bacterium]|nr:glycosyltransferase family A protein [Elusimicrobiales bacterium]